MIVQIGEKYWKRKVKKEPRVSEGTRLIMMATMAFAGGSIFGGRDDLQGVDIVSEYRLIQVKQSKLPRSKRYKVAARFESDFEPLPDDLNFLEAATP